MGHSRIESLPATRPWLKVVELLADGADVAAVAQATTRAAEKGLLAACDDTGITESFWLLTQLTEASRSDDFAGSLRAVGIEVGATPDEFEVSSAFGEALDRRFGAGRSDLGEMARLAAVETLCGTLTRHVPELFGAAPGDVQQAARNASTEHGFSLLTHDFFARFTQRFLAYHLSRELGRHVGGNSRFQNMSEHAEFLKELGIHAREAARFVRKFGGEWYSKWTYLEKGITRRRTKSFVSVALQKIRSELLIRGAKSG
jgi:hypothetical protein